jgi:hypothetical protein
VYFTVHIISFSIIYKQPLDIYLSYHTKQNKTKQNTIQYNAMPCHAMPILIFKKTKLTRSRLYYKIILEKRYYCTNNCHSCNKLIIFKWKPKKNDWTWTWTWTGSKAKEDNVSLIVKDKSKLSQKDEKPTNVKDQNYVWEHTAVSFVHSYVQKFDGKILNELNRTESNRIELIFLNNG